MRRAGGRSGAWLSSRRRGRSHLLQVGCGAVTPTSGPVRWNPVDDRAACQRDRRWVGWAARWRGRRGRDRRRWPRFRPDSRRRRFSMPRWVTPVPDGRWRTWPPAIPASAQNPCWASRASDCAFPQRPGRQHRPRAPSRPPPSAACPGLWPSYSVMSHRATIRSSACCGSRPALASLRNVAAPALGLVLHPDG